MSWITRKDIVKILRKENGLTAKVIGERLLDDLTGSALNRHLRKLVWSRGVYRSWDNGAYIYYVPREENKR